jgi:hypothetical protein
MNTKEFQELQESERKTKHEWERKFKDQKALKPFFSLFK